MSAQCTAARTVRERERDRVRVRISVLLRLMLRRCQTTFQFIVSLYLLNPLQKSIEEESYYRRGTYRLLLLASVKQTTSSTSLVALHMFSL